MGAPSCRSSGSFIEDDNPEQLTIHLDALKLMVDVEEEVTKQFRHEIKMLEIELKERDNIIRNLNEDKLNMEEMRNKVQYLEDQLSSKESRLQDVKQELVEEPINENEEDKEGAMEVYSDDNEGDGYRVDIDLIKIIVDVEADTRALVERESDERKNMPTNDANKVDEKKMSITHIFASESLDLEDTITSGLPDLEEQGKEYDIITKHKYKTNNICDACQEGYQDIDIIKIISDVEDKTNYRCSKEIESHKIQTETSIKQSEKRDIGVNTESAEDKSPVAEMDIIKIISDVEDNAKSHLMEQISILTIQNKALVEKCHVKMLDVGINTDTESPDGEIKTEKNSEQTNLRKENETQTIVEESSLKKEIGINTYPEGSNEENSFEKDNSKLEDSINTHLVKEIEMLKIQNDALLKQSNVEKKDVGVNTDVEESADEVHLEHSLVEEDNQRGDESLLEGQGESSVLSTDFPKLLRMKSVQERAINALRRWCRVY